MTPAASTLEGLHITAITFLQEPLGSMEIRDCPLPEVVSALGPFIKSRDEVAAIRRNLQAYLQKQLPGDGETPLTAARLVAPRENDLGDPPPALMGVRKAYWKALQANQAAQAKYDALKADLEALKRPPLEPDTDQPSINDTYIPLLRQKEKLRRLKVLERAYSSLSTLPSESLDDQLKSRLGAQPTSPSGQTPTSNSRKAPEVESKLLDLKKAALTVKSRVKNQEARNAVAKASLPPNEELPNAARIAGLQKALQELTVWMEEMLGVIADAEAEAPNLTAPTPHEANGTPVKTGPKADLEDIETAYEHYLDTRRKLVQQASTPPSDEDEDSEPLFPPSRSPNASKPAHSKPSPAELLLPLIPQLASLKSQETALLNQKSYLRRQLAASEDETARLIQRLAGESHLVQPGANSGADWAGASREAAAETEKVVLERIKVGEEWSGKARAAMATIEDVPEAIEQLNRGWA